MNQKGGIGGFLVAVLIVGLIIGGIYVFYSKDIFKVVDQVTKDDNALYGVQINLIKNAAKRYYEIEISPTINVDTADTTHNITLQELGDKGYISLPIYNPKTKENFNTNIVITLTTTQNYRVIASIEEE